MDQNPYQLEYWKDNDGALCALIPLLNANPIYVTLRGVEAGGVWLECPEISVQLCYGNLAPSNGDEIAKVVAFFPYGQIIYLATLDRKSLAQPTRLLEFSKKADPATREVSE